MRENQTLRIAVIANLAALSTLLYFFIKFPLPFIFPNFLDIQFSNLPAIIGGFMFGPAAGSLIVIVRQLIKLPFSSTAGVGELADLLIGLATVITSSVIYKRMRNKKGAIIASVAGMLAWIMVGIIANYYILIPFYIEAYFAGDVSQLVDLLSVVPGINEDNYLWRYTVFTVIPFNLLLSFLVYGLTFIIYKRLVHLIEHINEKMESNK
ncbi:MAG: ECF transporter S component [Candidatus Izemoplasmataceae bacterium]